MTLLKESRHDESSQNSRGGMSSWSCCIGISAAKYIKKQYPITSVEANFESLNML